MFGFLAAQIDTIHSSIAERTFERLQPRYIVPGRSFVKNGWEEGQKTVDEVVVRTVKANSRSYAHKRIRQKALLEADFDSAAEAVYECVPEKKRSMDTALGAITLLVHCFQDKLGDLKVPLALSKSKLVVLRAFHENNGINPMLAWLWNLAMLVKEKEISLDQDDVVPVAQVGSEVVQVRPC
jgi:hypothetical protein